ncbi:unnamed protein product [Periconia digitata]|uniref:Uncharacterized protein n=1 Tax=Periconia digitata TaxID=1303443 RepID=A0A9W4USM1_9PLEO|nr:unnamed protein product [Periconia digitata]
MSFQPQYHQQTQYYAPFQYQDSQVNPEVFVGYGPGDAHRSKTPTSLINHPRYSPGPLSTPPLSRNASQAPESLSDQPPEQMVYDDSFGSLSNSPTSVRTPDHEAFEVEMLDSPLRDYYNNQNGGMASTHVAPGTIPAMDATMYAFTDQDALNTTLPSQPQHFHPQQTQFTMQSRPLQTGMASQSYQPYLGHDYTNQPSRQDPWSGQVPLRNSSIPRSGVAVFDPVTDPTVIPIDYSAFNVNDIGSWTMNSTDPNYLVSPNDPQAPPQDVFNIANQNFMAPQLPHYHLGAQMHTGRDNPEMRLTTASPTPAAQNLDNHGSSSSAFKETYPSETNSSLSLITSIEQPTSPYPVTSPLAVASSPGSSDNMSYYPQSDPDNTLGGSPQRQRYPSTSHSPPSTVGAEHSPRPIPEVTFDISPEPERHHMPGPIRRSRESKTLNRPGGRALGTHLEPRVAKAAHDMRKTVACWHCVLQRDKCGPGDTCDRCFKRSQRPNADCGLGCSRIKLIELANYFLPSLVMQIHEDTNLMRFVSQFIHRWNNQEITVYITCSQKGMPRIPVKVYEFVPLGKELLEQIQYRTDPETQQRIPVKKESPPLGMVHINHNEEKKYDRYVCDIVDHHLDAFADICWAEDDNDFTPRLFKLMTRVKPKSDDEAKLLREVYRLIVTTYIMSHTLTIAEETKHQTLRKLHSYVSPDTYVQNFTSPRMTNRQLKYFFAKLQRSILSTVLNKLQQIFKSSKGCDKWVAAFVSVVGMCMAHEDQQKTIHQVMATRAATENMDAREAQMQAEFACREIDDRMHFVSQIFRWKYNRKCNPLKDPDHAWEKEVGFGDESSALFVRNVAQLVKENTDYLQQRQNISVSASNQGKYTARLLSKFVLSFWLP